MLAKGADPDACCTIFGGVPLHETTHFDNDAIARALLVAGADINRVNSMGATPLHDAASKNAVRVAKVLVNSGADLSVKDADGETPLHYASTFGHIRIAEILTTAGANQLAENNFGDIPSDIICDDGCPVGAHDVLVDLLQKVGLKSAG